jgi:phosphoserine phosphatase
MKNTRYALFDLDYTLIGHDTILLFANYLIRKNPMRLFYLFLVIPVVPFAAIGLIDSKRLKRIFLSFLFRIKTESLPQLANDFVKRSVVPRIYPELKQEIENHKANSVITVLNTAAPEIYALEIGRQLGFDHSIGTVVRTDSKRMPLFPVIEGDNNKRLAKIRRMKGILPDSVLESLKNLDEKLPDYPESCFLAGSFAYSDSPADLPMLRLVENGHMVHPEVKSYIEEGVKKRWKTFLPEREYSAKAGKLFAAARQIFGLYPVEPRKQP